MDSHPDRKRLPGVGGQTFSDSGLTRFDTRIRGSTVGPRLWLPWLRGDEGISRYSALLCHVRFLARHLGRSTKSTLESDSLLS